MKRILCILILCLSFIFPVTAFADYTVPADATPVEESYAQPYAEETRWVTRKHNGNYEMRLWSITYRLLPNGASGGGYSPVTT